MSIYDKIVDEYDNFAKSIIIYNQFCSGFLSDNITEEKFEDNVYGTYKNICFRINDNEDCSDFIIKCDKYLKKISNLFNENNIDEELDTIKNKFLKINKKPFYIGFCYLSECIELLARTDNLLYKFLINICNVDFKIIIKNDTVFLENCLLVQRIIKLFREVIFLHWKRKKNLRRMTI